MKRLYVALLRGVNVGGKNRLPMVQLKAEFDRAGATDARTFIQSGNVIFEADSGDIDRIKSEVADSVAEILGKPIPIVIRSAIEFSEAIEANSFARDIVAWPRVFVMFLENVPDPDRVALLDPNRSPGDQFEVVGKNIFLDLGTGAADSKLTNAFFDSKLKTISTARNWRTVLELGRLLGCPNLPIPSPAPSPE